MIGFFTDVIKITLPVSVLILFFMLFASLSKHALTVKWRYYIWLLVCIRLILPFPLRVASPVNITVGQGAVAVMRQQSSVFYIWLIGAALFLAQRAAAFIIFSRSIKKHEVKVSEKIQAAFEKLSYRRARVIASKYSPVPLTFGIFCRTIVLPDKSYTDRELEMILSHEIMHCRNHDCVYKLIISLARAVHWFNPFVHIMSHFAAGDIELNCDYDVTYGKDIDWRSDYCKTIVSGARQSIGRGSICSNQFFSSGRLLRKRIFEVLDLKKKRRGIIAFALSFVTVVLCGGAVEYTANKAYSEDNALSRAVNAVAEQKALPTEMPPMTDNREYAAANQATKKPEYEKKQQTKSSEVKEIGSALAKEETAEAVPVASENNEAYAESKSTLNAQSVSAEDNAENIKVSFNEESKETFSRTYSGKDGTALYASVTDGEGEIRIINTKTGEVAASGTGTVSASYSGEEEYSVQILQKDNSKGAEVYVFGAEKRVDNN